MPLGGKPDYVGVEYSKAVGASAFVRMAAHQLLANAYPEHRLAQIAYHFVEPALLEVAHGAAGLALAGKQHAVCLGQQFGIVGQ